MKISVGVDVFYTYELEIPDNMTEDDMVYYADSTDPIWDEMYDVIDRHNANYSVRLASIVDAETGNEIWVD